ncbi:MAG: hypothetical protein ABIN01_23500 [Ferruginibacter sp.]
MNPFGLQRSEGDGIDYYQKDSCELALNNNLTVEPFKHLYWENILNNRAKGFFHTDEKPAMRFACFNYEF